MQPLRRLMEPYSCGIGGDAFAIVWDNDSRALYGLNASGRSPLGLSYGALLSELRSLGVEKIPDRGLLPVSVPGVVDGWFALHRRFGKIPFAELLLPSIHHCRHGFQVTPVIATEWAALVAQIADTGVGEFQKLYMRDGRTPGSGEVFSNCALADSYDAITRGGKDEFYCGEIASRIDTFMRQNGGYIRKVDLVAHHSEWVEPVSVNYRGYDVFELPPCTQGIAALQMLKIVEGFDLPSMGRNSVQAVHSMLEAKKIVFEDRAKWYADPAAFQTPVRELLSREYARGRRSLIRETALMKIRSGDPLLHNGDTIYLTTADKEGNMVSFIQSIYFGFGSAAVVPGTGFALQNRGLAFSMDPQHPNVYAPGKRPFHTIVPGFVLKDDRPWLSFGVMGGDMQPQGHVQILTNIIDFGMDIQEAGDAPRWRHNGSTTPMDSRDTMLSDGGIVYMEDGMPDALREGLRKRGHRVAGNEQLFGGYQAILKDNRGIYFGASESRKDGTAAGY